MTSKPVVRDHEVNVVSLPPTRAHDPNLAALDALAAPNAGGPSLLNRIEVARAAMSRGELDEAQTLFADALDGATTRDHRESLPIPIEGIAMVRHASGDHEMAVTLLAAADSMRHASGSPREPHEMESHAVLLAASRAQLGSARFRSAWQRGLKLSVDRAIALARSL